VIIGAKTRKRAHSGIFEKGFLAPIMSGHIETTLCKKDARKTAIRPL
jgi:hypothetical protein